ncbi:MAG: acyl-CoA dehydrogenase family protein [Chloroflexi bacterium]|nr:acyl-CoA dehydrogenase family protein [Chloroflexota bacterium]
MDFRFTPEQENFRKEVREFLEGERKKGTYETRCDAWIVGHDPEFSKKVAAKGWIGMTWPKAYGGQGRTYLDRLVLTEELLRYGAPVAAHWFSDRQIGPSVIAFGTEEQKKDFLPRIIKGEVYVGLGMSEPEAGSDLASLKTRAVEEGDHFVVNGQKVWTSGAHSFNYIYLVVRTDPNVAKHRGISEMLVDMSLPGITVRPLVDMTGGHHFNEVFFDNVRVPKSSLMGKRNEGWKQIVAQLDYERSGMERLMANYPLFERILDYARETKRNGGTLSKDPIIRHRLAELTIEFEVGRLLIYRVAWVLSQGRIPNYEASLAKTYCTEFQQRLAAAAVTILGPFGQLKEGSKWVALGGMAAGSYLIAPGYTLQAGTSEILRNVIAMRGLGLPAA